MQFLRANTEVIVTIGPFPDVGDGFTPQVDITLGGDEAELIKHGSATVVDISGATWNAVANCRGYYSLTLTTGYTDTEGLLTVIVQDDSDCLPVKAEFMVLSQAAYDSLFVAKDVGFMDVNIKTVGRADAQETEANNLELACSNYSATRGLTGTAVPAVAADGAGGVPISDAGGLDLDTILTPHGGMISGDTVQKGVTKVTRYVLLEQLDGNAATGLDVTTLDLQYTRALTAPSEKVDVTALAATESVHADNKAIEIDATYSPGLYRIDWPDAPFASAGAVNKVMLVVTSPTTKARVENLQLVAYDPEDDTTLGLSALPDANAGADGGLPLGDANGYVRLGSILATALTETSAGYLAAAFKKLFDVETPALMASDAMATGYSTHDAAAVKTAIEADGSKLDHLWETTEDNIGTRRFSAAGLFNTPDMSFSADDAATVKTAIEADGSKIDHLWETTEDNLGTRRFTSGGLYNAPKTGLKLASDGLDLVTAWTVDVTGSLSGSVGSVTADVTTDTASRTASKATGFSTFDHTDAGHLAYFLTTDTGETIAVAGSVGKIAQGSAGGSVTVADFEAAALVAIAGSILTTPANTILTDADGYVTAQYPDGIPVTYSYTISSGNMYCARSDVEDVYGVDNVAQWADLDNDADGSKITARITRAIAWASAEMNDRLRGGPYELPISTSAAATVVSLAADLAGVWLYESRGVQDFDSTGEPIHQLIWKRKNAEKILDEIRAGKRRLDAVRTGTGTNAPMVGK